MSMDLNKVLRPKKFEDVIGQENLKQLLINTLSKKVYPQFSMYTGPSGTGKSTMANIVAEYLQNEKEGGQVRIVNMAEQTKREETIEMVKEIFSLKPGKGNLIYLLEEVQVLTEGQQTPFLEEIARQPEGVYVIMCTTEPRKLLTALKGRATTYTLSYPNSQACKELCVKAFESIPENVKGKTQLSEEDVNFIVKLGRNTPREIVKLVQQTAPVYEQSKSEGIALAEYHNTYGNRYMFEVLDTAKLKGMFEFQRHMRQFEGNTINAFYSLKSFLRDVFFHLYEVDKSMFDTKQRKRLKDILAEFSEEDFANLLTEVGTMKPETDEDALFAFMEVRQILRGQHRNQQAKILRESLSEAKQVMLKAERKIVEDLRHGEQEGKSLESKVLEGKDFEYAKADEPLVGKEVNIQNVKSLLGDVELYE